MSTPAPLAALMEALRVLPGVGPKSAQRMAYHLLQRNRDGAVQLATQLSAALHELQHCQRCNTFSQTSLCTLCASPKRNPKQLCIVEMPADLATLEHTQVFNGYYFVLMGRLSPLDGVNPEDLPLAALLERVQDNLVEEVVIATNFTVEGEATAHYLSTLLMSLPVQVSRIARGLPVGGELEYTDSGTLAQAFLERRGLAHSR